LEIEAVQKEMNEAINKATADHELKMRQLQDRVDALDRQVNEVIEKNKEEEQRLRREKSRMESALNAKIAQYDEDMDSRQKIFEELNRSFAKESGDYALLKEHFDKIDADITRHEEEDEIIAAVKRREQFGQFILFNAAAQIQKIFRGRQAREVVAKMKAKSKKGKKGKKGK
jgi:predicted nuclease with TOPRIM domain